MEGALASCDAGLIALEHLAGEQPRDPLRQWEHALGHRKMGAALLARDDAAAAVAVEPTVRRFAGLLRGRHGLTHVFLFGSRTRRTHRPESDYDLLIVGPCFRNTHPMQRRLGIRDIWQEAGGHGPLDVYCLTPEEFERARQGITLVREVLPEAIEV